MPEPPPLPGGDGLQADPQVGVRGPASLINPEKIRQNEPRKRVTKCCRFIRGEQSTPSRVRLVMLQALGIEDISGFRRGISTEIPSPSQATANRRLMLLPMKLVPRTLASQAFLGAHATPRVPVSVTKSNSPRVHHANRYSHRFTEKYLMCRS